METLWFVFVGVLLIIFVVMDGFDFGVGIIYHYVAKTNTERRIALNAIGPVWDGNEVWLIIAGGALFFAFPTAYASAFSGYYLALIMLLWLLMFRGLSMELRSQIDNPLWRSFWDAMLFIGSFLIALVLGAAIGNLLRGVPLNVDGYFFLPLWTNFTTSGDVGILDWFTVITGLFAIIVFAVHGANYLAVKTEDDIQKRARRVSALGLILVTIFTLILPLALYLARPEMLENYKQFPIGLIFPLLAFAALIASFVYRRKNADLKAFLASAFLIIFLMLSATFTMFPNILIATTSSENSLTIYNSATSDYALGLGVKWFVIGFSLALFYTFHMYRSFRGKTRLPKAGHGY